MVFKAVSEKIDFDAVKESTTLTGEALAKKQARDKELEAIIKGEDDRTLLVIGPCSSDNEEAVLDYAHRLAKLQEEVKDKVFMVMRVYTAKPRTNGDGYKGLVHQPDAEGKPNLINGIKAVRNLHYRVITETGITTADEMLYPENLPLVDDLVSYIAVGARSVEDQQHRFVASGIDVPTGMKNPTSGNLNVMFNGIYAAQNKQNFLFNGEEVETSSKLLSGVFVEVASEVLSGDFVEKVSEVLLGACVEVVPVVPGEAVVSAAGVCVTALSGETVGVEVLELFLFIIVYLYFATAEDLTFFNLAAVSFLDFLTAYTFKVVVFLKVNVFDLLEVTFLDKESFLPVE